MKCEKCKKSEDVPKNNWVLYVIIGLAILILVICYYVFSSALTWTEGSKHVGKGAVGDFFNGMIGPFIALIGALLTFAAFYVQFQANEAQKKSILEQDKKIEKQEKEIRKDRFEQRFFEMLKIHRENAANVVFSYSGNSLIGKEAFAAVVFNIEVSYLAIDHYNLFKPFLLSSKDKMRYAALFSYWGFGGEGENSKLFERFQIPVDLPVYSIEAIREISKSGFAYSNSPVILELYSEFANKIGERYSFGEVGNRWGGLLGDPQFWRGQRMHLSPYLRHLNRMVETLSKESGEGGEKLLTEADAKFYATLLRSQMTADEQKFLFYISLTKISDDWWEKEIMHRFAPFKNISTDDAPEGFDFVQITQELLTEFPKNNRDKKLPLRPIEDYFDDLFYLKK